MIQRRRQRRPPLVNHSNILFFFVFFPRSLVTHFYTFYRFRFSCNFMSFFFYVSLFLLIHYFIWKWGAAFLLCQPGKDALDYSLFMEVLLLLFKLSIGTDIFLFPFVVVYVFVCSLIL